MRWPFGRNPKPCDCDACMVRERRTSTSPIVSHGLHMWVGSDGAMHWRAKSRIVPVEGGGA